MSCNFADGLSRGYSKVSCTADSMLIHYPFSWHEHNRQGLGTFSRFRTSVSFSATLPFAIFFDQDQSLEDFAKTKASSCSIFVGLGLCRWIWNENRLMHAPPVQDVAERGRVVIDLAKLVVRPISVHEQE